MSSLIFCTDAEQAFVATDTLAVSYNGEPAFFTTKAFIVPHLSMIIAGTGVTGLLGKWFVQVNDRMVVQGINNLDFHTPNGLSNLWSSHKQEFSIPDHLTSTIYHFGFSEDDELIQSYAYRSANDFSSESIKYGLGVKPECNIPENYTLPLDIPAMMRDQIKHQSLQLPGDKLYIGGEIQVIHLTKDGFNAYSLCKFDEYDADKDAINRNYSPTEGA